MKLPKFVDLEQLAREQALPAPIHFQRRAIRWLGRVREAGRRRAILPVEVGGRSLDPLDLLRSELNLHGGLALQRVGLAEHLVARYPDRLVLLRRADGAAAVAELAHALRGGAGQAAVRLAGEAGRSVVGARKAAYRQRERARSAARRLKGVLEPRFPYRGCSILAVPRQPGHVADLLPVARMLRSRHGLETAFAVPDPGLAEAAAADRFPVHRLQAPRPRSGELRDALRTLLETDGLADPELGPVECRALVQAAGAVLDDQLEPALRVAAALDRLFVECRPRLVLSGNPYTLEGRTAARLATEHGARSAALEHGSIFPDDPIWQDCAVDAVLCWGEPSRRALLSCGLEAPRIHVVGAPRLDAVVGAQRASSPAARDTVLVATSGPGDQVSHEQHRWFIQQLFEAARSTPSRRWVVKLHKKDAPESYLDARGERPPNLEVVRAALGRDGQSIFDFLARARVLITVASTAALDAMIAEVPVVTVDVRRGAPGLEGVEFLERGCTHRVDSAETLAAAVEAAFGDGLGPELAATARSYAGEHYAQLGRAAEVAADALAAMMDRGEASWATS
jgi:hypothetical protein